MEAKLINQGSFFIRLSVLKMASGWGQFGRRVKMVGESGKACKIVEESGRVWKRANKSGRGTKSLEEGGRR